MAKAENGVWAGTTFRAVKPGAWRYTFNVDGVNTWTRATSTSPSQTQVQSLLVVPGDFSETRDVPHGAVGSSGTSPGARERPPRDVRLHAARLREGPVQLSGAVSDPWRRRHGLSWSTVGRAGNILDNLIADKKALPMIVVMPSGWTPSGGQVMTSDATKDSFNDEMMKDIIPFVQANYRTKGTPEAARCRAFRWAASRP